MGLRCVSGADYPYRELCAACALRFYLLNRRPQNDGGNVMKLDRNINPDGKGKYALIKLRMVDEGCEEVTSFGVHVAWHFPDEAIDFGRGGEDFFVIRLKDRFAEAALRAYAQEAREWGDFEYAREIEGLADAARDHPNKKTPD
jgi:hypothetical protein